MKYKEYDQAVKDINELFKANKDENVQALWEVVSELWANNEEFVVEAVCDE